MRVFVTGASGHIGSAVVPELLQAGHQVVGLARSDSSAGVIAAAGAEVRRGNLDDLDGLREAAGAADGVIHMAFGGSFADPEDLVRRDHTAIETLGQALAGAMAAETGPMSAFFRDPTLLMFLSSFPLARLRPGCRRCGSSSPAAGAPAGRS